MLCSNQLSYVATISAGTSCPEEARIFPILSKQVKSLRLPSSHIPAAVIRGRYRLKIRQNCCLIQHQMMLILMHGIFVMRTTLNIDDELLARAMELTGITERTALVRAGLEALVQRECGRRLARLGGTQPNIKSVPRRRPS